jgi:hypothetical protein
MSSTGHPSAAQEDDDPEPEPSPCVYCAEDRTHPLFLCLLVDGTLPHGLASVTAPKQFYVSASSQPFARLLCHNRQRGLRAGGKATKAVAPNWVLELAVEVKVTDVETHKLECRLGARCDGKDLAAFLLRYFTTVASLNGAPLYQRSPAQATASSASTCDSPQHQ